MKDKQLINASSNYESDLPAFVKTSNGVEFDPRSDKWAYGDSVTTISLDFSRMKASPAIVFSVKKVLVWYAENRSPETVQNLFYRLNNFLLATSSDQGAPVESITEKDILNYRAKLKLRTQWYLGYLSGLFRKWHQLSIPGITDNAIALLKQLRIKGTQKGEAVLTRDPVLGSFTDIEFQSIQVALDSAYADGEVSLEDYLLVWLFMALGQRPIQYASLKVCDVIDDQTTKGVPVYILRVPRAKQHGQLCRKTFKKRALIRQIGEKLVQHRNDLRNRFKDLLEDPDQAPLFPGDWFRRDTPQGFEYHRTVDSLTAMLKKTIESLKAISERTGKPLHINARRFRRTVGTRAAKEGHGELVIAELLDHSDISNVGVYVQAEPEIVERIDRAIAMKLAPLAQAFAGMIIADESEAMRADDLSSRVCCPFVDSSMKPGVGNCGKHGFCRYIAPIACYTCRSFQPWLDGPHEAVLDYLIAERARLNVECDSRIASINDRTILAVAEVIRRCDERRKETRDATRG
jgi:integrase